MGGRLKQRIQLEGMKYYLDNLKAWVTPCLFYNQWYKKEAGGVYHTASVINLFYLTLSLLAVSAG